MSIDPLAPISDQAFDWFALFEARKIVDAVARKNLPQVDLVLQAFYHRTAAGVIDNDLRILGLLRSAGPGQTAEHIADARLAGAQRKARFRRVLVGSDEAIINSSDKNGQK